MCVLKLKQQDVCFALDYIESADWQRQKSQLQELALNIGTPTGNRTPVAAVKGQCPNR